MRDVRDLGSRPGRRRRGRAGRRTGSRPRSLALPVVDGVGRSGRSRPGARRRPCRCPGTRSTSGARLAERISTVPGPAHLVGAVRARSGSRRRRRAAALARRPARGASACPSSTTQPLLHRVVEVVRVRPLAVCELVDARRRSAPRRSPSPTFAPAPAVAVALRGVVELRARRRSCRARTGARSIRARAPGRDAGRSGSRSRDLRVAALAVDQHRLHPDRPARPRCRRAACRRPSPPRRRRPRAARAARGRSTRAASSCRARARSARRRRRARGARRTRPRSRDEFESSPILSPRARSSTSVGIASS